VRLLAIELTESVRSFHVPATPGTCGLNRPVGHRFQPREPTRVTFGSEGPELVYHGC